MSDYPIRGLLHKLPNLIHDSREMEGDSALEMKLDDLRKQRICLLFREWAHENPSWNKRLNLVCDLKCENVWIDERSSHFETSELIQVERLCQSLNLATNGREEIRVFLAGLLERMNKMPAWTLEAIDRAIIQAVDQQAIYPGGSMFLAQVDAAKLQKHLEKEVPAAAAQGRPETRL